MPTAAQIESAKGKLTTDIEAGKVPWSNDPLTQLNASADILAMAGTPAMTRASRSIRLGTLRQHLADGETALVEHAADEIIRRDVLDIVKGSPKYRDLCQRLLRGDIEALERGVERDSGNWSGVPKDPIVKPPLPFMAQKLAAPGESIMELFDRFKNERRAAISADTWDQNRKIVKLFAEFVGEGSHITAINRKAVRDWKHKLSEWPRKAGDIIAFKGMSFRKVIERNVIEKKPVISQRSINKYLSALGGFAEWLLANDFINEDVMRGMYLAVDKRRKTRLPFNTEQLNEIFGSALFRSCRGDKNESKPGNVRVRDWRYWIPLIALFTGARLGEIAQMLTADVRQLHGVWVFHITQEGSELKSTKTLGSQRVVPIHSELIAMGFLDYHKQAQQRADKQLFPELKQDARGFFSGDASKFFNKYFRAVGAKTDNVVNFHSFRHCMADAFRRAGYLDSQFGILLGHTEHTMSGQYGILPQGPLADRVKMIEAVSFPGLELSHLKIAKP
jgi:integrase